MFTTSFHSPHNRSVQDRIGCYFKFLVPRDWRKSWFPSTFSLGAKFCRHLGQPSELYSCWIHQLITNGTFRLYTTRPFLTFGPQFGMPSERLLTERSHCQLRNTNAKPGKSQKTGRSNLWRGKKLISSMSWFETSEGRSIQWLGQLLSQDLSISPLALYIWYLYSR
jgi:hypothetical protein